MVVGVRGVVVGMEVRAGWRKWRWRGCPGGAGPRFRVRVGAKGVLTVVVGGPGMMEVVAVGCRPGGSAEVVSSAGQGADEQSRAWQGRRRGGWAE